MPYNSKQIDDIAKKYDEAMHLLGEILDSSIDKLVILESKKAEEYLSHGFMRRLSVLKDCIVNVYNIFPPDRKVLLSKEELANITINLQAFAINIAGALDNLAWVYVFKRNIYVDKRKKGDATKVARHEVGLFKDQTLNLFPQAIQLFLKSGAVQNWKNDYLTPYRDSLAHRIPLYVPPKQMSELDTERQDKINEDIALLDYTLHEDRQKQTELDDEANKLGSICYSMRGSFTEIEGGVLFHIQILEDISMLGKISRMILEVTQRE